LKIGKASLTAEALRTPRFRRGKRKRRGERE
jgi:hypothetical protein